MKRLIPILAILSLTALSASARTWKSADGKSTFEGELIAYNAGTGEVTVDRGGKRITFKQQVLSAGDIDFLKNWKATPATEPKPAESSAPSAPASTPVNTAPVTSSAATAPADKPDYIFKPAPFDKRNTWLIRNFGPVGIGIMLEKGPVMKINNVEPGSPAEKTGKLNQGDIIESINGIKLSETKRDPRMVLGDIITEAEATNGKINLQIKDKGTVTVDIPVLGAYSDTWPLNCPKSDRIVRNLADLVAKQGKGEWGSVLFLLSTGEEKDLEVVRGWMKERKPTWEHNWSVGVEGMGICEYYLRTGDASILPMIQNGADHLRDRIYNGGWSGRGASFNYQSGGHLNAAGVHCLTFLMLAKTCGVNVDEKTLQSSLSHFFDYSGKGSVPYGDYVPKPGFRDCNGKTGGLAMALTVAARLTPEGEKSIYAKAAQTSAMKAYYGTHDYNVGHTGGGIGEIWKSAGVQLMAGKRPKQHHEYLEARRWSLELSRRHTGAMGIAGGEEGNYDQASGEKSIAWGTFNALNYTAPRKHLHIYGAPLSKFAKSYQLPVRPKDSVPADDDFNSPFPVPGGPWTEDDMLKETLMEQGGWYVPGKVDNDKVTDETLLTYLHHPEITYRFNAMGPMLRFQKDDMLLDLLRSKDARLRHVGIMAMHELWGTWRPTNEETKRRITPEMMAEVDTIIRNPEESAFTRGWAVGLLQHADLPRLRTFRELLVEMIDKGTDQSQVSAINVSIPFLTDPESYQIIFPPMMKAISTATSYPVSMSTSAKISKAMETASPEIQAYGLKLLKTVYGEQPKLLVSKDTGIYVIPDGASAKRFALSTSLGFSEEGRQFMKSVPRTTLKSYVSGKESDMFRFSGTFKNDKKYVSSWIQPSNMPDAKNTGEIDTVIKEWLKKNNGYVVPTQNSGIRWITELLPNGDARRFSPHNRKGRGLGDFFWTDSIVFSVNKDEACQMEIRSYDGNDFLIIENGGFAPVIPKEGEVEATPVPPDFHCGYQIHVRQK
jgi:hypothetical protein